VIRVIDLEVATPIIRFRGPQTPKPDLNQEEASQLQDRHYMRSQRDNTPPPKRLRAG
jgi:hypothetical protein